MPEKQTGALSNGTHQTKRKIIRQDIDINRDLLDTVDAMALMHCSRTTLYNWRDEGLLPYCPIGRKIYFLREDLLNMVRKFRRRGVPPKKKKK